MRSFSVVIFALAVAAIQAAPSGNGTDNKLEDLVDAYLAFAQNATRKLDPLPLRDVRNVPIVTLVPPVGILLSAVNRTVSGLSSYSVSNETVQNNTAQWRVTYPEILGQSDYKVSGLYYGRRMSGQGHAKLSLTNVTVDVSVTIREVKVRWPITNTSYLQIAELNEVVNVGGVATNLTGLTVSGLSDNQVTQLLDAQVTTALNLNLPIWERIADETARRKLNIALIGSTIDDAINWLRNNTNTSSFTVKSLLAELPSM